MILNIKKVSTRISIIHNIPKKFFKELECATSFGHHLFPSWCNDVFKNTDLQKKFGIVYNSYKTIKVKRNRLKIIKAFENSNQIERLCDNDLAIEIITIKDLPTSIQKPLEDLFSYLYNVATKYPQFTKYVKKTISTSIDDFIYEHKIEVCPICGLEGFANIEGKARLALDHWLCQDIFPFSSVNFNNLIPIGGDCNSRPAKGSKNVLIDSNTKIRKIAFYPYKNYNGVSARFAFDEEPSFENQYGKWNFKIEPKNNVDIDYFDSWDETFNIKTRYNSFVEKNILKMWISTYTDYIDDHELLVHATDLISFKNNLKYWKASFMKKKYPGYKAYRSFINHLLQDVTTAYLTGIYQNILSSKGLI